MRTNPRSATITAVLTVGILAVAGRIIIDPGGSGYDTSGSAEPSTAPLVCINPTTKDLPEIIGLTWSESGETDSLDRLYKIFVPSGATLQVDMEVETDDQTDLSWQAAAIGQTPPVDLNNHQPLSFMPMRSFTFGPSESEKAASYMGTNTTGVDQYYILEAFGSFTAASDIHVVADLVLLDAPDDYREPDC